MTPGAGLQLANISCNSYFPNLVYLKDNQRLNIPHWSSEVKRMQGIRLSS